MIMLRLLGLLIATLLTNTQSIMAASAPKRISKFTGAAEKRPKSPRTALYMAADGAKNNVLRILVDAGAKVNDLKNPLDAPLLILVEDNNIEGMDILISSIYDTLNIDAADKDGFTALHHAADRNKQAALTWLLAHGASPYAQTKEGAIPLHFAAKNGHLACCQLLFEAAMETLLITTNKGYNVYLLAKRHATVLAYFNRQELPTTLTRKTAIQKIMRDVTMHADGAMLTEVIG